MDPERTELLQRIMKSAIAGSAALQSPQLVSDDTVLAVEELADWVKSHADLRVPHFELCTDIRSYGNFSTIPDDYFISGRQREVAVYCEVENFSTEQVDAKFTSKIAYRLELYTPEGHLIWQDKEEKMLVDVCENRRRDYFFGRRWWLPAGLSPGDYVLKVIVEDKIKQQTNDARFLLTVHAAGVAKR